MWWTEFEKSLTRSFAIHEKFHGRVVYDNQMKLRVLTPKIKTDFLGPIKAAIEVQLSMVPMTMTDDV